MWQYLLILAVLTRSKAAVIAYDNPNDNDIMEHDDDSTIRGPNPTFPCDVEDAPSTPPTSVHKLRPSDVKVIGAMGDSISSGFGTLATKYNIEKMLMDYRGVSFGTGTDESWEEVPTLANLLKEYNDDLVGSSTGHTFVSDFMALSAENAGNNVALTGSSSNDLTHQANILTRKILTNEDINNEEDWKVITIMSGHNNLMHDMCEDYGSNTGDAYKKNIEEALQVLHDNLKRTFVNLVSPFDINILRFNFTTLPIYCQLFHALSMPCVYGKNKMTAGNLTETVQSYWRALRNIAEERKFERQDFTVVYQPITVNLDLPKGPNGEADFKYVALDCIHPSKYGHGLMGTALWNSMLAAEGEKPIIDEDIKPKCTTKKHPFFATWKNSKTN